MKENQFKNEQRVNLPIPGHDKNNKKEDLLPFYLFVGALFLLISTFADDNSIIAAGFIILIVVIKYKILRIQHREAAVKENFFRYLKYFKYPSVIALVLANSIPLIGVLFWQWNLFSIVLLYWLETGVMGFYNIFKIRMAKLEDENPITISSSVVRTYRSSNHNVSDFEDRDWGKEKVLPVKYYSLIYIAKLLFLMAANGGLIYFIFYVIPFFHQFGLSQKTFNYPIVSFPPDFLFSLSLFFISHGVSFFYNYIWQKEYQNTSPSMQMDVYDKRFLIMHLTILAGALFIEAIGSYTILLVIMIVLKIKFDIDAHIERHSSTLLT